jgi:hypothetical protein
MDATKVVANRRQKHGGRTKGTPNKVTAELKGLILTALDNAGGVEYLSGLAVSHPPAFASLLGKVLPMQVTGEAGGPLQIIVNKLSV